MENNSVVSSVQSNNTSKVETQPVSTPAAVNTESRKETVEIKPVVRNSEQLIAEISGLDRKEVDKAMKQLKEEGAIVSPVRCKWAPAQ
jgi:hypothetical protein